MHQTEITALITYLLKIVKNMQSHLKKLTF